MADRNDEGNPPDDKNATADDSAALAESRSKERRHHGHHPIPPCPSGCELGPGKAVGGDHGQPRAAQSFNYRYEAARDEYFKYGNPPNYPTHDCNGDEALYKNAHFIGSFTKGLPHTDDGEVVTSAYCKLLVALDSGLQSDFNKIPLGCTVTCDDLDEPGDKCECPVQSRKLENPQGSYAFDLEGADSHSLWIPPAPAFGSEAEVADVLENYWMALARDIPFIEFPPHAPANPLFAAALADLSSRMFYSAGGGEFFPTALTPSNLFRGFMPGDQVGPYVSQFLLQEVPYGAQLIPACIRTLLPGIDFMTTFGEWLSVQRGCDAAQSNCDPNPRLIRSPRDLGQFVHVDATFNAFLNAALLLWSGRPPARRCEAGQGLGVPLGEKVPYINPAAPPEEEFPSKAPKEIGMETFGFQHITSLLFEVMNRALKAAWYQKWLVHRRLRPEAFGGRLHRKISAGAAYGIDASYSMSPIFQTSGTYSIFLHNARQNVNKRSGDKSGTYLLPQEFAEGSPLHPSYGAGHATVSGACATILKAFFAADQVIGSPVVSNAAGTALLPYTGDTLTVGGELEKLASNISLGRNFAGVHWRSDHTVSLRLGEKVAISMLFDQRELCNEAFQFKFNRFSGTPVQIDKSSTRAQLHGWMTTY